MSSTRLVPSAITAEALRLLEINTPLIQNIDKQHDKETEYGGQKRGPSIRIRLPNQYVTRDGWTINAQEEVEQAVTLTVGTAVGVDMYFTEAELAQNINDFSRDHLVPAMDALSATLDSTVYSGAYKQVYNSVGTPGTTPNSPLVWLQAVGKLFDSGCPQNNLKCVMNSDANIYTVNGTISLQNDPKKVSNQFVTGRIGTDTLGISSWWMSQNVPNHTCGSRSGTILIDDAGAANAVEGGTTIHIDGLGGATQTVAAGDVFTVAAVYSVNPKTKQSTGKLQQFVVTTAATASSSEVDLTVSPAMYTSASGGLQNITAFPVDGAAVTFMGTASTSYPQNLVFHQEFATFATANLTMPNDVTFKAQMASKGINIRILKQFQISDSTQPCRSDVYYGYVVQRPQFACRVWG
jgi:hypothetical protein